jgi:hypothetical protein
MICRSMSDTQSPAEEPAHDVLAAEAFAVPASDPSLHHGPVVLPEDPTGIAEPHDVLAAEEFAMPSAPLPRATSALTRRAQELWRVGVGLVAGGLLLVLALRLLRRR